ncbi:MOSC N-terminal beta barrel domain-containing protein [Coniochaeta ligniaria NRRL 30616]|uniref:Molybdenum cofactor sulfurase n=1 Tax=Coniochaeta ligniaria NRRL 30616 TaxID=1408157 RepID=A0A1J7J3W6_9PEZI|nr:MOSC N-terminal beta barrel domain-containing protein [Coniochaeta ligniaria NRRL 30616]
MTDVEQKESGDVRYNEYVERLRHEEYPMLEGSIYLDHAGTTPYPKSLMDLFAKDMTANLFGNPHSASSSSQLSTSRIEDTRLRVLQWFKADPAEFDLIFVANATAGIKLVVEALRAVPGGFDYVYHQASHTSLVGVRQEARSSTCFDEPDIKDLFEKPRTADHTLIAYPAQSNMDGRRLPLSWSHQFRQSWPTSRGNVYTILDAAALAATSPLDLSDSTVAPDFTVISFYKIFGFPDLGGLIVRRQAEPVFDARRYFGGGTVDMVVCRKEQWHVPKRQFLHERLEDGTLPVHSIVALDLAMNVHRSLFGSMDRVAAHTYYLVERLDRGLRHLRHGNGTRVCTIYSPDRTGHDGSPGAGPVVAFNLRNQYGAWVSLAEFEKLATLKNFHVRTGGVCNPGGIASALDLEPWEMKQNFSSGFRCGTDNDIMAGKPTGIVRASLGAMSTVADVDQFIAFVDEFYREAAPAPILQQPVRHAPATSTDLYVERIIVYPIKSCGGYRIPAGTEWEVRPEGLAWDREWCLLHRGSGQALSQKRHPKMALLRPDLDFERGELRVSFAGVLPPDTAKEISVPLSNNPAMFEHSNRHRPLPSRVCGDEIFAQTYTCDAVNDFFSGVLGVPCVLARFPPGGQGPSMRHSKAHLQKHQMLHKPLNVSLPGSYPAPPSPPDSDTENPQRRILLSNESPILAINLSSLAALNKEIVAKGGQEVPPAVFRANVVVGSKSSASEWAAPYAEDNWSTLRIGQQNFKMLGSCRRCHMVSIDQDTAEKSEEPFVTLSKTRRFDGKVFFGSHMGHAPSSSGGRETQYPTIKVGDMVQPDAGEDEA